jgi:Flp pilus assembly protein TadG
MRVSMGGGPRLSRGGSIVELAVSLPVLCLLVLGGADVARAFYYREAVANGARQALRMAVSQSQQGTGDTVCTSSSGVATTTVPAAGGSAIAAIANDAAVESSTSGAASGSPISGASVTVRWHCLAGLAVTNATNAGVTDPSSSLSDAVEVTVTYTMPLLLPLLQPTGGGFAIPVDLVGRAQY